MLLLSLSRYATRAQRSLVYQLPVPWPGDYQVELYFAETCPCASEPGQRVFDVELEGKLAATIDVVSEAGFLRAHSVHLSSRVTDGSLTLEMLGLVRNPILSAIKVRKEALKKMCLPFLTPATPSLFNMVLFSLPQSGCSFRLSPFETLSPC